MRITFSSFCVAASLAVAACANPATKDSKSADVDTHLVMGDIPASDPRELAEFKAATSKLYQMKEKAFRENKVDPIVKRFYAANVVSVGPSGKPEVGREALTKGYNEVVPRYEVKVEPVYSYVNGNAGWDWANFRVKPKDPKSTEKPFSFVILFLWSKVNGQWVSAGDAYVVGEFPKTAAK